MDLPLARTSSNGSDNDPRLDGGSLTAVYSASSAGSSKGVPATNNTPRTATAHSLLGTNTNFEFKKPSHVETNRTSVDRQSLSMPQIVNKPGTERRMSASIASLMNTRTSEDIARSPPASVKSFDDRRLPPTSPPTLSTPATDTTIVTATSALLNTGLPVLSPPEVLPGISHPTSLLTGLSMPPPSIAESESSVVETPTHSQAVTPSGNEDETMKGILPPRPPRKQQTKSFSSSRRLSSVTLKSDSVDKPPKELIGIIGVCALDAKARSRPSRQILTRLQGDGEFEVIMFGDKTILDEDIENWPLCDFLISFFSDGFPLDKAIAYAKLRKPFIVNDLPMQKVLWDRRLCLKILDQIEVPSPKRIEVVRDGGPRLESVDLAQHVKRMSGVTLEGPGDGTGGGARNTKTVEVSEDGDSIVVDGKSFKKPFVEKPVDGEDHNIIIYFPKSEGGGARRLFRKIGNKSSEYDPNLIIPRCITEPGDSYIYEQFLKTENAEDVKAYTVGPDYCHAETRKSPVVDGLVRRNLHGKELRYVAKLNDSEKEMASRVSKAFGQRICGFDMLRTNSQSYVIDVNGWSFVKDNETYYNDCAKILKSIFSAEKFRMEGAAAAMEDYSADPTPVGSPSQHTSHNSHRASALKTILNKSTSMGKLSSHLSHSRHSRDIAESPRLSSMIALSSPPSVDNRLGQLPATSAPIPVEPLPPPIIAPSDDSGSTVFYDEPPKADLEAPKPQSKHSWKLKGVVNVIRHADRTPKQKVKFTAHSSVFVDLLKGHHEEVLLKGEAALASVEEAVKIALKQGLEDPEKLKVLRSALAKKGKQPGTKVQIKPMFRKRKPEEMPLASPGAITIPEMAVPDLSGQALSESPAGERSNSVTHPEGLAAKRSDSISGVTFSRFAAAENEMVLDKLQLVMKWGGEPTHSARYQAQDLGKGMREDLKLLNKDIIEDVSIFTSSEKRVVTSAQIFAAAFLDRQDLPEDFISVRKDLLDDSNAAKDVMDKVKKKLKTLLRAGNSVPAEFAWPKDVPEPYIVMQMVIELLRFHRKVMRHNYKRLSGGALASLTALSNSPEQKDGTKEAKEGITVSSIQSRWCTGEDAELFKERWEKLFTEFCDSEKADPSKVSELYDTMKYDALHNRAWLEYVFTPTQAVLDEVAKEEGLWSTTVSPEPERADDAKSPITKADRQESTLSLNGAVNEKKRFSEKIGLRRKSILARPPSEPSILPYEQDASIFKLFAGCGDSRAKQDQRLVRLRELYRYSKILFDYICPQEYGISNHEKLEIGLLTSLPLLREIVQDLEELQASNDPKCFIYFTKESHVYTLLNCIMEGGIETKIKRAAIPELDYLSQICFELFEAKDSATEDSTFSIRVTISPGCHTVDPLDVSLDSKHAIGSAPKRGLTSHGDWIDVITTLKAKFNTVQLPKSFLAVNVSDKHEKEAQEKEKKAKGNPEPSEKGDDNADQTLTAIPTPANGSAGGDGTVRKSSDEPVSL